MNAFCATSHLALALGLVTATPTTAQDPAAALDAYVERNRLEWEVPGLAVAVVHDGQVVLAKGYGVRQLGEADAVDEHTLFSIGSTTKAMTTATLGLSVDAGLLTWDDLVITHWPGFRLHDAYATRELTVRDLLTHRAGLGNADRLWYGRDRPREEIIARIPLIEPVYSLRAGFVYQNIMYVAAGELAGRLAGSSWEDLVSSRLFQPLGMERTVPTTTAAERMTNVARPHYRIEGQVEVIQNEILDTVAPAGAVWSSVSDMSRWLRMLLDEGEWNDQRILSEATVSEMLRPQTLLDVATLYPYLHLIAPHWTSYGLGWFQLDYH
ncbi:MAG: serine hydrolase domain-containing protein, partial [Planctomycetota bacterium]